MARARNVKPSTFTNELLAECDPLARLLFIGLWCHADREGRMENRPKRIKSEILPYDNCDAVPLLDQLERGGFILRYEAKGVSYIQILAFKKHQHPHVNEVASTIPAPPKHQSSTRVAPEPAQPRHDALGPLTDSLLPHPSYLVSDASHPAPTSPSMADPPFAMPPESKPAEHPKPPSESPLDLKAEMWRRGVAFLVKHGCSEKHARSLLGKWRKLVGNDAAVINLLARAEAECASEPIAWIEGALKSDAKRNRQTAQQDPAATVADRRAAMLRAVGMVDGVEVGERSADTGPCPRPAAGPEAGSGGRAAPSIGPGIPGGARSPVGVRGDVRPAGREDRGGDENLPGSADGHPGRRAGERDQADDGDVVLPLTAAAGGHPQERERGIDAPAADPVADQDRGDVRPVADDLTRDPWVLYERIKRKEIAR